MQLTNRLTRSSGQSLIELLVALGVAAMLLPALITGIMSTREGRVQQQQRLAATALVKEAEEAVRVVREKDWNVFAVNGTYHPAVQANTWVLTPGPITVDDFTRSVTISDVYRDSGGAIAPGGSFDPSTKQVLITISWSSMFPSSVSSTIYLARLTSKAWVQTTSDDFISGTPTNTTVTNERGGEVQLGAGGHGNWCNPETSLQFALNLPGQGITQAISAVPGHAYTTTGENASGDALDSISIANPPYPTPPTAAVSASYNTNKAYGIYAATDHVFVGSDHPGLTVIILDPSTLVQQGYFSSSGGERPGKSIYTSGTTGFVTAGSKLYAFDIGTIRGSSSQSELWNVTLAGTGQRVMIYGGYAFVATADTTNQLQIVNLENRAVTNFSAGNGQGGTDVFVDASGSYAYLVTTYTSGISDFFIVDISDPLSPRSVGNYSTNGMNPKGVVAVPGNRVIIVGSGGLQYQVLNITDKTNPVSCVTGGGYSPSGLTAIHSVSAIQETDGDVYSYILTDNPNNEFQIIQGGPGGQFSSTGMFESTAFDATHSASFNYFSVHATVPNLTSIQYRVAGADPVAGSCTGAAYTFVGTDASTSTYFATSSAIPYSNGPGYKNPAQCFKYRVYFTSGNSVYSPVFEDITVNYSP